MKVGNKKHGLIYIPANDKSTIMLWFVYGVLTGATIVGMVWIYGGV